MSIITNEDCRDKVFSKFDLVLLASQRVRDLNNGIPATIKADNTKVIIALKEIAAGSLDIGKLREAQISSMQKSFDEVDYKVEEVQVSKYESFEVNDEDLPYDDFDYGTDEEYIDEL